MVRTNSSPATRKLVLRFILEHIEYRKRCLYLQEIIAIGKKDTVWRRALASYFDTPLNKVHKEDFCTN